MHHDLTFKHPAAIRIEIAGDLMDVRCDFLMIIEELVVHWPCEGKEGHRPVSVNHSSN